MVVLSGKRASASSSLVIQLQQVNRVLSNELVICDALPSHEFVCASRTENLSGKLLKLRYFINDKFSQKIAPALTYANNR